MRPLAWGYAMLMSPNEDETAVHVCHCLGDMVVRMRKVLGPYRGVDTCATVLKLELFDFMLDIDEKVVRGGSLKRVQCFAVVRTAVHVHGAHLVRMYVLPHGGLTSLNLRVHSIIT